MPSCRPQDRRRYGTIKPPVWLGYAFISVAAVLILHSLAMKKAGRITGLDPAVGGKIRGNVRLCGLYVFSRYARAA